MEKKITIDQFWELLHGSKRIFITVESAGEGGTECQLPSSMRFVAIDVKYYQHNFSHFFAEVEALEVEESEACVYVWNFIMKSKTLLPKLNLQTNTTGHERI